MNLTRNTETHSYRVRYYTDRGRWVGSGHFDYVAARCDGACPHMPDVAAHLRGLRDSGGQDALPGPAAVRTGEWNGYMLVEVQHTKHSFGDSVLVLPAGNVQDAGEE